MNRGSVKNRLLDRYIGIPILLAISPFKRRTRYQGELKRIGIMASPGLGDTLLNSAAVIDLRSHFPGSTIFYIVPSTSEAAARLLLGLDEVVRVPMTEPLQTIRIIRRLKLDAIIDFTPWPRLTAFYCAFSGAKLKVGFRSPGQYRHWNYDVIADHSSRCHELENFRILLGALGLKPTAQPRLAIPSGSVRANTGCERRIVFHPWASGERASLREWPADRWIKLARKLSDPDATVLITGAPGDSDNCAALCGKLRAAGIRTETLCGAQGLQSVAAVLRDADLVVSVNTGIMHLAAIVGAPTVSLNGPTATHRYGPIGPRATSVEPHGGGGGFLNFGFEFDGNPADTMLRIRVQDVVDAAFRVNPSLNKNYPLSPVAVAHKTVAFTAAT